MDWEESLFTWRCYIINIYTELPFPCSLCLFWHTGKILKDKKCRRESEENEKVAPRLFLFFVIIIPRAAIIIKWVPRVVALFAFSFFSLLTETNYLSYGKLWALFTFIHDWMNSCLLENHCPPTHKRWKAKQDAKQSEAGFQLQSIIRTNFPVFRENRQQKRAP